MLIARKMPSSLPQRYVDALAIAVLAVVKYPVANVARVMPRLRDARLLEPAYASTLELGPMTVQLFAAGYERGLLTSLFADRLKSLMESIERGELDALKQFVESKDEASAKALIRKVRGLGPKSAENAWRLLLDQPAGTQR